MLQLIHGMVIMAMDTTDMDGDTHTTDMVITMERDLLMLNLPLLLRLTHTTMDGDMVGDMDTHTTDMVTTMARDLLMLSPPLLLMPMLLLIHGMDIMAMDAATTMAVLCLALKNDLFCVFIFLVLLLHFVSWIQQFNITKDDISFQRG